LTSPQEDAEKYLSLFPNLEQGDSSSSVGAVQKCYVNHWRAAEGPGSLVGNCPYFMLCIRAELFKQCTTAAMPGRDTISGRQFPFLFKTF